MNHAKWIWYGYYGFDLINRYMQARRVFTLTTVPKNALIHITADARYKLYVNGILVSRGPARGFQDHWPYDSVEIASYLKPGRNVLAVIAHSLGISNFQYLHQGYSGLLVWGKIGNVDISTNNEWRVRPAPEFKSHTQRVSIQLGFQEHLDLNQTDTDDWKSSKYKEDTAKGWHAPSIKVMGGMPWNSLEVRGIPLMKEVTYLPQTIVSQSQCISIPKAAKSESNVVERFVQLKLEWEKPGTSMKSNGDFVSLRLSSTGQKDTGIYCLDMEKEIVGSVVMDITGAAGGERVSYMVCEAMDGFKPVIELPSRVWCKMAFGNQVILKPGHNQHEQYDHWGFRYLVVMVENIKQPLSLKLRINGTGYPLDIQGAFKSSSKMLNRVYQMSVWTQECCMLDAYVDCPWREQAQWWGDARVQGANTYYLSADYRLIQRGIRQIGTQELPNGLTYGHAPTMAHECILPDFTLVWLMTFWDDYWQTGDLTLFKSMESRIHRALEYFETNAKYKGLLSYDNRYWLFLDWSPVFKDGYPTLYNLLYLAALRHVAELFKLCKNTTSTRKYALLAQQLEKNICKYLFDSKTHSFNGGLDWKFKPVKQEIPHVYAWAVLLKLFPEYHRQFVDQHLLPLVRFNKPTDSAVPPSPYFMYYIFQALKQVGKSDEVISCIERWWGDAVHKGYTTTPEMWNAKEGDHSLCHAWSAHPIVHFSNILLGIWQVKPAWKEICYAPDFTNVSSAQGKLATPLGVIESRWVKKNDIVTVSLKLPGGMNAVVKLPGRRTQRITGRLKVTITI